MEIRHEGILREALKRLQQGPTKVRWQTFTEARMVLEDAITELAQLRAATSEWACRSCKVIYPRQKSMALALQTCPSCERVLVPHVILREEAFCARIDELSERVAFLEEVTRLSLSFVEETPDS